MARPAKKLETDPLREALREAIARRDEAQAKLDRERGVRQRAEQLVSAAEARLTEAQTVLATAQRAHTDRLVKAARTGAQPPADRSMAEARLNVLGAEEDLATSRSALASIDGVAAPVADDDDDGGWRDVAEQAAIELEQSIDSLARARENLETATENEQATKGEEASRWRAEMQRQHRIVADAEGTYAAAASRAAKFPKPEDPAPLRAGLNELGAELTLADKAIDDAVHAVASAAAAARVVPLLVDCQAMQDKLSAVRMRLMFFTRNAPEGEARRAALSFLQTPPFVDEFEGCKRHPAIKPWHAAIINLRTDPDAELPGP